MPDYSKGKIYCIRSPHTDDVYIGSTTISLSMRMAVHRYDAKMNKPVTSSKIILCGDAYIELIEECRCETKEQLNRREGEIMRAMMSCVNKCLAGRTWKERYDSNRDCISKQKKEYYQANSEKIKARMRSSYKAKKENQIQTDSA